MGLQASCTLVVGEQRLEGTAHLEPEALSFASPARPERLRLPLASIASAEARGGRLDVESGGSRYVLELGRDAEAWALKIRYPKARLDKLGVKPDSVVTILGVDEADLVAEIRGRTPHVSVGRVKKNSTLVLYGVRLPAELDRLAALRDAIVQNGAIWTIWPKGRKTLREDDVRRAAKAMGLVDVKVVSVSDELSGLKLVIPVAARKK